MAGVLDGLLATLDERDVRAQRRFFWPDWGRAESDRDIPARIGYLVASRAVERLLERHALAGDRALAAGAGAARDARRARRRLR